MISSNDIVKYKMKKVHGTRRGLFCRLHNFNKTLSKHLVTQPVKIATGVDTEMPYQNKVYGLPKYADDDADIEITLQQRKVFDSKEFYRKDLLVKGEYDGKEADP